MHKYWLVTHLVRLASGGSDSSPVSCAICSCSKPLSPGVASALLVGTTTSPPRGAGLPGQAPPPCDLATSSMHTMTACLRGWLGSVQALDTTLLVCGSTTRAAEHDCHKEQNGLIHKPQKVFNILYFHSDSHLKQSVEMFLSAGVQQRRTYHLGWFSQVYNYKKNVLFQYKV